MKEDILTPVCFQCKHLDAKDFKCKAFPEGIPDEILGGFNYHENPLPGQKNKIVFEQAAK